MTAELRSRLEECQIGIASRGQKQPDDTFLSPHLWEQLRQRLQGAYRRATGETHAVLSVDAPAPAELSVGSEPVAWTTKGNLETLASTPKEARYMWGLPSGSTISVPLYASPQAPAELSVGAESLRELLKLIDAMPRTDRGFSWEARDWQGNEAIRAYGENAAVLKFILDNTDTIAAELRAALASAEGSEG
jgi:hypothetical protein